MAVAVQEVTSELEQVVDATISTYRSHMEHAVAGTVAEFVAAPAAAGAVKAISIPGRRTIEVVPDADTDIAEMSAVAWMLLDRGWHLDVLCRTDVLGAAHASLRGVPCRLQGWWVEDLAVHFGSYERP